MNVNNIIELLRTGISEDKLGIPKRTISAFHRNQLISSMDIIKSNNNYSIEGAVKLRIYAYIRWFWIPFMRLTEIEKEYRSWRMFTKPIFIRNYSHTPTPITIPILNNLAYCRNYVTLDDKNIFEYVSEEDLVENISYGKDTWKTLNGRILIDLWVILEDFWLPVSWHSKWTINKLRKAFESNKLPVRDRKWRYYSETTYYYNHPRELPNKITLMLSKPYTSMTLKSNNNWSITSITYKERNYINPNLKNT